MRGGPHSALQCSPMLGWGHDAPWNFCYGTGENRRRTSAPLLPGISTQDLGYVRLAILGLYCEIHLAETRKSSNCFLRLVTVLSWGSDGHPVARHSLTGLGSGCLTQIGGN